MPIRGYRYLLLTLSAVFVIRDLILKQNNDDKKMKKVKMAFSESDFEYFWRPPIFLPFHEDRFWIEHISPRKNRFSEVW